MVKRGLTRVGDHTAISIICVGVALLTIAGSVRAGDSACLSATVTHRVYTPTAITPDAAKAHLVRLGLGTVSQLPMTNGLLITGEASVVTKAFAVLKVVDVDSAYEVSLTGSDSIPGKLPTCEQLAAALGDVAVGSLEAPPAVQGKAGVILDRHQGQILVIAPKDKMEQVMALVGARAGTTGIGHDLESAGLDRSALLHVAEVASWTKSHVLGAAQTDPNITAAGAGSSSQPVSSMPSGGRITQSAGEGPSNVKALTVPSAADPNRVPTTTGLRAAAQTEPVAEAYPTPEVPNADQKLQLDLPEKLPIDALLEYVGNYLHLDFMYDPAKVQGEVTLKLQGKLKGSIEIKDLYPLLESVLKFKGFVMTRRGNIVTVMPAADVMDADPKLRTRGGEVEFGDAVITRVFRLRHVEPASAEDLLTQMKLGVAFSKILETKTLIVTAFTATMPRVEAILDLVDQPGEPKQFRYRQLNYTLANALTDKVKTLAEQMGTIQFSISTTAPRPPLTQLPGEAPAVFQQRVQRDALLRQSEQQRAAAARAGTGAAPEAVYLDADERTNRVLMVGRREQLAIVDKLVDSLDVQQQDLRSMQCYRIEHVDAQDVRKKLEELNVVAPQAVTPTSTTRITGQRAPMTPGAPAQPTPQPMVQTTEPATGTALDVPQVVVVEATNSLLVNATAEQHKRIGEILKYVDSETLDSAMPFEIYPLENQGPDRMAEIIGKLIEERLKDKEGKIEQVVKKIEDEITIVPDPNTFSLVVHASPKNQQWIAKLVDKLDKRRPQVLIDLTLVEISKTDDFNYALNAISSIPDLTARAGLTGGIAGSVTTDTVLEGLRTANRKRFIDFQANAGSGTGFYGDKHVNLLLTAMQERNYGRVLAKPKILVNDNETGTIDTTETTYVIKRSSVPRTSGTTGTQENYIETAVDYAPYPAGITLGITPHISEGDLLRLEVELKRSDFTSKPGDRPPDTTASNIKTVVTVPDKSTIILGGMIKLNQSRGGTKVPLLGDLPLLGTLFRSTGNSDLQKKLYVFVKAEIIRPADFMAGLKDLETISDQHRRAFEQHEAEFQGEQSIPGVRSKPMSPNKVLDAQ